LKNSGNNFISHESDAKASSRKEDHIDLAFKSAVDSSGADPRFYYEPILSGHPEDTLDLSVKVAGKEMRYPIWVSSMTGGTEKANAINHNLAKICGEFGLGMGLGSCRQLLYDDKRLHEFDIRSKMPYQPLMTNLGIAQVEELIRLEDLNRVTDLISKLNADGLIIHVNPLQEWLQPEGDRFKASPISIIKKILERADYPIIVKEVGQGFGKQSLIELLQLPLECLDLAGFGGTNFSKLELMRTDELRYTCFEKVFNIGHTCKEMLAWINDYYSENPDKVKVKQIIFSGGIKNFLDGYYLMASSKMPAFYAQASGFLKHALDYQELLRYTQYQIEGLKMAKTFLKIKS